MATGLALPVGVDTSGGARLVSGENDDRKVIVLSLGSGWSENAFQQDIALGQSMIFDISDNGVRARIKRRLQQIFRDFETQNRYKLLPETLEWVENGGDQQLELSFKYANLETDEVKDFTVTYDASGIR